MDCKTLYEFVEERANDSRGFSGEDMLALSPHLQEYEYAPGCYFHVLNDCYWLNDYGDVCRACFIPRADNPNKIALRGLTLDGKWRGFHFRPSKSSRYPLFIYRYKSLLTRDLRLFYAGSDPVGFIITKGYNDAVFDDLRKGYEIGQHLTPNLSTFFYL